MVPVSVLAVALKPSDDDIGAILTNQADHILQKHLIVPFFQSLVQPLGITEIDSTAEKEVNTVVAHSSEMLLGPYDTQRVK